MGLDPVLAWRCPWCKLEQPWGDSGCLGLQQGPATAQGTLLPADQGGCPAPPPNPCMTRIRPRASAGGQGGHLTSLGTQAFPMRHLPGHNGFPPASLAHISGRSSGVPCPPGTCLVNLKSQLIRISCRSSTALEG